MVSSAGGVGDFNYALRSRRMVADGQINICLRPSHTYPDWIVDPEFPWCGS